MSSPLKWLIWWHPHTPPLFLVTQVPFGSQGFGFHGSDLGFAQRRPVSLWFLGVSCKETTQHFVGLFAWLPPSFLRLVYFFPSWVCSTLSWLSSSVNWKNKLTFKREKYFHNGKTGLLEIQIGSSVGLKVLKLKSQEGLFPSHLFDMDICNSSNK